MMRILDGKNIIGVIEGRELQTSNNELLAIAQNVFGLIHKEGYDTVVEFNESDSEYLPNLLTLIIWNGFDIKEEEEDKGLTPDQKRIHWETYVKKTERQEEVFKKVFENVFEEQKNRVVNKFKETNRLEEWIFNNEQTAKKFEPAIELVYESAFQEVV